MDPEQSMQVELPKKRTLNTCRTLLALADSSLEKLYKLVDKRHKGADMNIEYLFASIESIQTKMTTVFKKLESFPRENNEMISDLDYMFARVRILVTTRKEYYKEKPFPSLYYERTTDDLLSKIASLSEVIEACQEAYRLHVQKPVSA